MTRKKRSRKNFRQHKNIHHVFPTSRMPGLKHAEWNQVSIDTKMHSLYHQLFSNRTPQEIIEFLKTYFWGERVLVWTPKE